MSIDEASAAETSELRHRFQKYQDFLEDTVLPDLAKATQSEAKIDEEQRTYRALDNGVRALMAVNQFTLSCSYLRVLAY